MPTRSPRIQICFPALLLTELRERAQAADLPLSGYLRRLCLRGLAAEDSTQEGDLALTGLATLVSAEQALALLESVLPDGARRSSELRDAAIRAAENRLESVRSNLADKGQG